MKQQVQVDMGTFCGQPWAVTVESGAAMAPTWEAEAGKLRVVAMHLQRLLEQMMKPALTPIDRGRVVADMAIRVVDSDAMDDLPRVPMPPLGPRGA